MLPIRIVLVGVMLLLSPAISYAEQDILIHTGFMTGQDYLKMNPAQQNAYAAGIINGMLLAPLFGAPKEKMMWFENCVTGMTDSQGAAILKKYLEENPGRWHETPHTTMFNAMLNACPKTADAK